MFEFIARNKLKSILRNTSRKHAFLDIDRIHSVLLLSETKEFDAINKLADQLEKLKKNVTICMYRSKKDNHDYSATNYIIIDPKKHTNKWGMLKESFLEQLQTRHYDALFDLTINEVLPLEYIAASVQANMKVGLKKNDLSIYDLSISNLSHEKDPGITPADQLSNQILHYLKTIRGEKN